MFHSARGASNLETANPLPQIFLACTASLTTPVRITLVLPSQSSTPQVGCRDVGAAPSLGLTCATLRVIEPSVTPTVTRSARTLQSWSPSGNSYFCHILHLDLTTGLRVQLQAPFGYRD